MDTRSCRPAQLALILASLAIVSAAAPAAAQTPITACPFATTGPGNYEVIQNLTSASNCITIAHDHVSIDLKGHTIEGAGGDGSGAAIIDNGVARRGIIMHNGTIQKFAVGVHLNFSELVTLDGLTVLDSAGTGITVGARSTITRTTVRRTDGVGILLWACCHTIRDVTVVENRHGITGDNDGFETSHCCSVLTQIEARNNAGVGIYLDGGGNFVTHSIVRNNAGDGVYLVGDSNLVSDSTVTGNGAAGILLEGSRNAVLDSEVARNGTAGIAVHGSGEDTVAGGHVNRNGATGVSSTAGLRVVGVTADDNGQDGLDAGTFSLVVGSKARNNGFRGLRTDCPGNVLRLTASGNLDDLALTTPTDCALLKTPAP